MSRDLDTSRSPEHIPPKINQTAAKTKYVTPAVILGAIPLLLVNWLIVIMIQGRNCVTPSQGNMTDCGTGLSEEQMLATSALIALAILVIQLALIVLLTQRIRSTPR
ncbi:hypothetical protein [Sphaerisporangium aureirubrum]|uniref:ABC transporter permease n=1 Tax=Sphaerisporangium aureirubrum TaxID=1544736 RepID=A0ABW1NCR5_9ACTN